MPLKIIISLQLVRDRLHAQIHNGNKTTIFEPHFVKADSNLINMVISMDAILRVECFIASADQI